MNTFPDHDTDLDSSASAPGQDVAPGPSPQGQQHETAKTGFDGAMVGASLED